MFREMRRKNQLLPDEESIKILTKESTGILALEGEDGYPYAVPLNYTYNDGKIYFHCAKSGHKIDLLRRNNKVSFCVIEKDEVVADEFLTKYRSVILFGRAKIVEGESEIIRALRLLVDKYSKGYEEKGELEIQNDLGVVAIVEIEIDHITGKEARKLMQERSK